MRIIFLQRFLNQSNSSFTDQKIVACATSFSDFEVAFTIKVKIDGTDTLKGSLIKGPYKPICRDLYHRFFDLLKIWMAFSTIQSRWLGRSMNFLYHFVGSLFFSWRNGLPFCNSTWWSHHVRGWWVETWMLYWCCFLSLTNCNNCCF